MSLKAIVNAARTLVYYQRLQNVLANNLANAESDGFKADRVFGQLLSDASAPVTLPTVDLSQGSLKDTGRALDLALEGPGFFVVQSANGERLIRGGALQLDAAGQLVDVHGNPLLGVDGPVFINGSDVEIQPNGTVLSDGQVAGTLRIEDVEDPATLTKEEAGRFIAAGDTVTVDPTTTRVQQGALEESNFETILGMIDMVSIQREFQANVSAMRSMDAVLDNVVNDLGRPIP